MPCKFRKIYCLGKINIEIIYSELNFIINVVLFIRKSYYKNDLVIRAPVKFNRYGYQS